MSETEISRDDFTVAVVFAMDIELNAFKFMLDHTYEQKLPRRPGDPNRYTLGRIGPHNVVLARPPNIQGKGAAATVVANLSSSFPSIIWRLLVGIGGGVPGPDHDIQLGDVVVSMPTPSDTHGGVVQYDFGRGAEDEFRHKGFLKQPPSYLVLTASDMMSNHLEQKSKIGGFLSELLNKSPEIHRLYKQPDRCTDILFPADVPHTSNMPNCEDCDKALIQPRPSRNPYEPKVHYGLIASGDEVVVATSRRDEYIRRVHGDVLCFEMEAAGIATEYPCLVIRGISDYADPHKTKDWQYYASATAAATAKELLCLVEPDDVERTGEDAWRVKYEEERKRGKLREKQHEEALARAEETIRARLEAALKSEWEARQKAQEAEAAEIQRAKDIWNDAYRRAEEDLAARSQLERAQAEAEDAAKKESAEEERSCKNDFGSSEARELPPAPIKFKDVCGRKFTFPFHLCKTWLGMEELIKQASYQVDGLGAEVARGRYSLVAPSGATLSPETWESLIQPGWQISMQMWPAEHSQTFTINTINNGFFTFGNHRPLSTPKSSSSPAGSSSQKPKPRRKREGNSSILPLQGNFYTGPS